MTDKVYDIIIIGAGIAGLSAAYGITEKGNLSVAIIEGKGIGSSDPSPLTFADTLKAFDLVDCKKASYSTFTFQNYQGSSIRYSFKGSPLVVLDYEKACYKLFNKTQRAGNRVELINQVALSFSQDRESVTIQLGDGKQLRSRIMIDCSGKRQFTITTLGDKPIAYYSHIYGATFSNPEDLEPNMGSFLWPYQEFGSGGGWFYPLKGAQVSFGYASISNSRVMDPQMLREKFHRALAKFEPYARRLQKAKLEKIESGWIPITYAEKLVHGRIVIAGDASGMATNWTCMGIEPALKYGALAGELSAEALAKDDLAILNEFQSSWAKENKATYDWVAKQAARFWKGNYHFWEWIIKNDLAFLTPSQVLERMRRNKYLPKKHQVLFRAAKYKIRSILDRNTLNPSTSTIGP